MILRTPGATRTATLLPYTTLVRSFVGESAGLFRHIGDGENPYRIAIEQARTLVDPQLCIQHCTQGLTRSLHRTYVQQGVVGGDGSDSDRKSTRLNSSH